MNEFVELARIGNYTKASQKLYISQSVLSKHIKALESELGIPLFVRGKQGIRLSEQGEMLLPYASQIMALKEEYLKKVQTHSQALLRIASVPAVGRLKIGDLLAGFVKENPNVAVNIIEGESALLLDRLQREECDLAFARGVDERYSELVRIPYIVERVAAFFPVGHPMASRKHVEISELRDETFICSSHNNLMYHLVYDACVSAGFEPKIAYMDNNGRHTLEMVEQGVGISLRNSQNNMQKNHEAVCQIPIVPPIETVIYLYYHTKNILPVAERFIQYVVAKRKFIEETL